MLAAGDAFCPKCGIPCGVAGATPQPVAASVNAAAAQPANDGSYLAIDTNPSDRKTDSNIYILEADQAIKDINKAIGFDESLYERMSRANALAGMQNETGNGVRVSWDYHPKNGLEVTYSIDNE